MNPQDGADHMLRALAHLKDDLGHDRFRARVVGDGDSVPELMRMTKELGLESHVEFTGYRPFETVLEELAAADIMLHPDPKNPLNDLSTTIKSLEYAASARPVVAFDLKEARWSLGEGSLYAEPNDDLDFARCIGRLMDDPELRRRLGRAGRLRFEQSLAWERVSAPLGDLYRSLGFGVPEPAAGAAAPAGAVGSGAA
jgi:glycosyltransferase involved in cell wall biosynthesis